MKKIQLTRFVRLTQLHFEVKYSLYFTTFVHICYFADHDFTFKMSGKGRKIFHTIDLGYRAGRGLLDPAPLEQATTLRKSVS